MSPTVVVIPLLTAKTSVCWNPILYIVMNPQVNDFNLLIRYSCNEIRKAQNKYLNFI